ncbi:MAG: hypothetical protein ACOCQW_04310 [Halanaerobiaceae bacterium]
MKKIVLLILFILMVCILTGCPDNRFLVIQPTVINLEELNTEYDDFNSMGPPTYTKGIDFVYSTNSPSAGENFDINYTNFIIEMTAPYYSDGVIEEHGLDIFIKKEPNSFLGNKVNSDYNEYGPYILNSKGKDIDNQFFRHMSSTDYNYLQDDLIYTVSSDKDGDFNIYYYTESDGLKSFAGNKDYYDDYYLTYHKSSNSFYFCSNRDGSYNIYSYSSDSVSNVKELLDTKVEPKLIDMLNSTSNDKCPYIFEDIMVFVSDRDSVEDKFDIYFSKYDGSKWSKPKKLPTKIDKKNNDSFKYINTFENNEYRPILMKRDTTKRDWQTRVTDNMLMIFSSDRPGGNGGYDLYLAVLPLDIFE